MSGSLVAIDAYEVMPKKRAACFLTHGVKLL